MRNSLLTAMIIAVVVGLGVGFFARSFVGDSRVAIAPTLEPATPAPTPARIATATPSSTASGVRPNAPTPAPTAPVAAAPASRDVVMEVSEADLDQQFASKLVGQSLGKTPLGDATVQSVAVQLRDKQVKLDGNANVGFLRAPFSVIGTVTPNAAGKPMVSVSQAMVGGVVLPDTARDALAESVQTQVDSMFDGRDVKVQTIDIADGKMRIVGTRTS
jgi:hypothetical protein